MIWNIRLPWIIYERDELLNTSSVRCLVVESTVSYYPCRQPDLRPTHYPLNRDLVPVTSGFTLDWIFMSSWTVRFLSQRVVWHERVNLSQDRDSQWSIVKGIYVKERFTTTLLTPSWLLGLCRPFYTYGRSFGLCGLTTENRSQAHGDRVDPVWRFRSKMSYRSLITKNFAFQ